MAKVLYKSRVETYKHIKEVNRLLILFAQKLLDRATCHDDSKLEEPEAELFEKLTPLLATTKYPSSEYDEQLKELGPALEHHYSHNRHHPEFHKDGVQSMNLIDLIEMYLDWTAACQRQNNGNINKSIEINQQKYKFSDDIKCIMENTVDVMENI